MSECAKRLPRPKRGWTFDRASSDATTTGDHPSGSTGVSRVARSTVRLRLGALRRGRLKGQATNRPQYVVSGDNVSTRADNQCAVGAAADARKLCVGLGAQLRGAVARVSDLEREHVSRETVTAGQRQAFGRPIKNRRVNGVDVVPLVEAELNRRYPDRVKMRPTDADGFREAWDILEGLWQGTVDRARGMGPELLHEQVDGEWSFIETLRHLVFATDAWVKRAMLGEPSPWDPLDLPHDEMPDEPRVPRDRDARPSLDEVLALRADRMATARQVIADLTDETLAGMTEPVMEPGYPEPESFAVRRCLHTILNEEWEHRLYAERDLDVLESRSS